MSAGHSHSRVMADVPAKLQRLLTAAMSVPYYAEHMRSAGYDPVRDFRGPQDLSLLPIVRKSDIKAAPDAFVQASEAGQLGRYFSDRTSGSTGTPLTVFRCPRERDIQIAKWLRVLLLSGYRPTHKVLSLTSPGRLAEGRSVLQRFALFRRKAVDYTLPPEALANQLIEYRPDVVYGVRTSLLLVAEELARRDARIPAVKLLVAGGEVIDGRTRRKCQEAFGIDLTETYGTVELGVMAYQARADKGLRLIEDCTFFEFLDEHGNPAKPGQLGRVVVTDLHGWLMPFIRYEQGDLAQYSLRRNARGETVRVIDRIVGRQDDLAPLPDGRLLTYLDFYELMDVYPGVTCFKVRQQTHASFIVELVTSPEYYRTINGELLEKLRRLSALPLHFDVKRVESIAPDPNGKLRMLVSEVGG
jgi:phenylacetate-CoA ligase